MSTEGFLPFPEDESESEESPGLAFTHVQPEYEQTRHTSNNDQIVPPESPGRGREVLERGAAEECQRLVSNQSSVNLKSRKSLAESQRPMDPSRNFKERPKRETQASMEDAEHENQELKIVNQKLKEKIRNLKIKEREIQAGERELQLKKEEHTWQVECHQSEIILQAQELSVRRKKLQLDREEKLNKEEYTVQVERRQSDIKLQAQELSLRREKLQLDEKELEIQERRFSLGNHLQRLLIANENLREENQRLKSEVKKLDRQIYILAHPIRPEQGKTKIPHCISCCVPPPPPPPPPHTHTHTNDNENNYRSIICTSNRIRQARFLIKHFSRKACKHLFGYLLYPARSISKALILRGHSNSLLKAL